MRWPRQISCCLWGGCNIERQGKALVGGPRANGDQVQEVSWADTWARCASARAGDISLGGTVILPMEFNDLICWCFDIRLTSPNEDRKVRDLEKDLWHFFRGK